MIEKEALQCQPATNSYGNGTSIRARIVQIMDNLALSRKSPTPKTTLRQVSGRALRLTTQQLAHAAANNATGYTWGWIWASS